jgi:hypothetical protein
MEVMSKVSDARSYLTMLIRFLRNDIIVISIELLTAGLVFEIPGTAIHDILHVGGEVIAFGFDGVFVLPFLSAFFNPAFLPASSRSSQW